MSNNGFGQDRPYGAIDDDDDFIGEWITSWEPTSHARGDAADEAVSFAASDSPAAPTTGLTPEQKHVYEEGMYAPVAAHESFEPAALVDHDAHGNQHETHPSEELAASVPAIDTNDIEAIHSNVASDQSLNGLSSAIVSAHQFHPDETAATIIEPSAHMAIEDDSPTTDSPAFTEPVFSHEVASDAEATHEASTDPSDEFVAATPHEAEHESMFEPEHESSHEHQQEPEQQTSYEPEPENQHEAFGETAQDTFHESVIAAPSEPEHESLQDLEHETMYEQTHEAEHETTPHEHAIDTHESVQPDHDTTPHEHELAPLSAPDDASDPDLVDWEPQPVSAYSEVTEAESVQQATQDEPISAAPEHQYNVPKPVYDTHEPVQEVVEHHYNMPKPVYDMHEPVSDTTSSSDFAGVQHDAQVFEPSMEKAESNTRILEPNIDLSEPSTETAEEPDHGALLTGSAAAALAAAGTWGVLQRKTADPVVPAQDSDSQDEVAKLTEHHEIQAPTDTEPAQLTEHHEVPVPTDTEPELLTEHHDILSPTDTEPAQLTQHHDVPVPTDHEPEDLQQHHEIPEHHEQLEVTETELDHGSLVPSETYVPEPESVAIHESEPVLDHSTVAAPVAVTAISEPVSQVVAEPVSQVVEHEVAAVAPTHDEGATILTAPALDSEFATHEMIHLAASKNFAYDLDVDQFGMFGITVVQPDAAAEVHDEIPQPQTEQIAQRVENHEHQDSAVNENVVALDEVDSGASIPEHQDFVDNEAVVALPHIAPETEFLVQPAADPEHGSWHLSEPESAPATNAEADTHLDQHPVDPTTYVAQADPSSYATPVAVEHEPPADPWAFDAPKIPDSVFAPKAAETAAGAWVPPVINFPQTGSAHEQATSWTSPASEWSDPAYNLPTPVAHTQEVATELDHSAATTANELADQAQPVQGVSENEDDRPKWFERAKTWAANNLYDPDEEPVIAHPDDHKSDGHNN